MDIIYELKNYKQTKKWIELQILKYKQLKEQVYNLKSQFFDGMPKVKNWTNDRLEMLIDKCDELLKYIEDEQNKIHYIIEKLNTLNPIQKNILYSKYILNYSNTKMMIEFNYSERHIYRIIEDAFEELKKS